MTCPQCNKESRVIDSRGLGDLTWRRRRCPEGHLFHTNEVITLAPSDPRGTGKAEIRFVAQKSPTKSQRGNFSAPKVTKKSTKPPKKRNKPAFLPVSEAKSKVTVLKPIVAPIKIPPATGWKPPTNPDAWAKRLLESL
jgi:hypothetical protein